MTVNKKFVSLLAVMMISFDLFGHGEQFLGTAIIKKAKWSPVQISFWPVHLCGIDTKIYGLNLSPGLFGLCPEIYGISCGGVVFTGKNNGLAANFYSCGVENNGLALGVFNSWQKNNGVSVALANFVDKKGDGGKNMLQIGLFNQAYNGFQIGLLNYNPNAMIPWMPLVNIVIPRSVESSLEELRKKPYPFDYHIEQHAKKYFPDWNVDERLQWLNELFPLTDAGATSALMEAAKKSDMLQVWDDHALTLPMEQRKRLRYCLGIELTRRNWFHHLETTPDGTFTLTLNQMYSNAKCSFTAKFKNLPENVTIKVVPQNSDLLVGFPVEKTIKKGNTITQVSDFVTLFTVRRDAETDLWYESGSWKEVRKNTPAVTTYKELWRNFVCTQIVNDKRTYKEFKLKEPFRRVKLGTLEAKHFLQIPCKL